MENQSLYWHPTIYEVTTDANTGDTIYTRAPLIEMSPYYRWHNSVLPRTEAFPPGFRMIAHSDDLGANLTGDREGGNLIVECCNYVDDPNLPEPDEVCTETWDKLDFPTTSCASMGIGFGESKDETGNPSFGIVLG